LLRNKKKKHCCTHSEAIDVEMTPPTQKSNEIKNNK
jgi:hypothetical protein